eukprot:TRINITY_DN6843_c0_g1_i10.p1 TRINITY_DN6843_c0_g1~~TRINITY_DN6843_c0_g1_i10.p1  ORF type:complete len:839 (+),score=166.46 TRINITY_DN6843_c0_g1_i10:784-3300(+)
MVVPHTPLLAAASQNSQSSIPCLLLVSNPPTRSNTLLRIIAVAVTRLSRKNFSFSSKLWRHIYSWAPNPTVYLETHPEAGFVKGYTVGFGAQEYIWRHSFEENEKFLRDNLVTATAMIRKSVLERVGGFDTSNRQGMEDWEFWLAAASKGMWGTTIPETMDWYRRRPVDDNKWRNFKGDKSEQFKQKLKLKYASLYQPGHWPRLTPHVHRYFVNTSAVWQSPMRAGYPMGLGGSSSLSYANGLSKARARLLIVLPWFAMGGADKFNLNLVRFLASHGIARSPYTNATSPGQTHEAAQGLSSAWEITIVATSGADLAWMYNFLSWTPDVFVLPHFLKSSDFPRFLCYLVHSRQPDVLLLTNSELAYLLVPFLRAYCPGPAIVDYTHMEEENWKGGGYPRYSVAMQNMLDLNIVASTHLKTWMVQKGASDSRIEVATINVDEKEFRPDPRAREMMRNLYKIPNDPNHIVVLFAARLAAQKQPKVVLNVFKNLAARRLTFTGLIAGDGPLRDEVDEFLGRFDLSSHVKLLGPIPPSNMKTFMAACDIIFLPSRFEGISSIIYEGMSVGLVPVSAAVGGQAELVTDEVGVLVELPFEEDDGRNNDPDEAVQVRLYTDALQGLLEQPKRVHQMAARARERIQSQYSLGHMGRTMVSLFCQAMQYQAARPRSPPFKESALEAAIQGIENFDNQNRIESLWRETQDLLKARKIDNTHLEAADKMKVQYEKSKQALVKLQREYDAKREEFLEYQAEAERMYMRCEEEKDRMASLEQRANKEGKITEELRKSLATAQGSLAECRLSCSESRPRNVSQTQTPSSPHTWNRARQGDAKQGQARQDRAPG